MTSEHPIKLMGVPGSPYTRKMLALLRYRRIPYRLLLGSRRSSLGLPLPKVSLLPTFYFPDAEGRFAEAVVDSTPIIRRLESLFPDRSVLPEDPAIAFLDYVLEDYADEWLTKAMFHYRWHYPEDTQKAGDILPLYAGGVVVGQALSRLKAEIVERQVSRLYVVGSNPTTASIIEESYVRYLQLMTRHLERAPFLFGARPAASDFAAFGQLTQLARFDPTPMALTSQRAPRVAAWVETMEDLGGVEPKDADWFSRDEAASALEDFFVELGRTYVPVMLANAKAVIAGASDVQAEVEGRPWRQKPFPYQAKCMEWIRGRFDELSAPDQAWVREQFSKTGCERLLGAKTPQISTTA